MISSMLGRLLPPSFLDTYCLSSLGCKALYIGSSFLVLWSICWCSSLVYFKNGIIIILPLESFSDQRKLMVFHRSLSDNKSPQVSRALFSILVDLNNTVVWMVCTRPLISESSNPWINPLVAVPRAPIIISITVTFMFHSFSQFLSKIQVLILLFAFFQLYSVVSLDIKVHNSASSFLLLIIIRSGRLAEIRWSHCISKSQRSLCISFSKTDSELCKYDLFVWSNLNLLHNSQWSSIFL